jgi:hypothetical protein
VNDDKTIELARIEKRIARELNAGNRRAAQRLQRQWRKLQAGRTVRRG